MPTQLQVGPVTYTVACSSEDWVTLPADDRERYGCTQVVPATIHVNPTIPPGSARLTLLHEALHACCQVWGSAWGWEHLGDTADAREETIIGTLEAPILVLMRDNPELMAYLAEA